MRKKARESICFHDSGKQLLRSLMMPSFSPMPSKSAAAPQNAGWRPYGVQVQAMTYFLLLTPLQLVAHIGYKDIVDHFTDIDSRMGTIFLGCVAFRVGFGNIFGTIDNLRAFLASGIFRDSCFFRFKICPKIILTYCYISFRIFRGCFVLLYLRQQFKVL